MIILFKYCVDIENCESFRDFSYIYIEREINNIKGSIESAIRFSLLFSLIWHLWNIRLVREIEFHSLLSLD